jgi:hypothetical protein
VNSYDRHDPAKPPNPTNYKAEVKVNGNGFVGEGAGPLTCTVCEELLCDVSAQELVNPTGIHESITRHNAKKHKDLLYVFTSAGWVQAGYLIPDPVEQINNAIDAEARSRGLVFPPGNPA